MKLRMHHGLMVLLLASLPALESCQGARVSGSVGFSYGTSFGRPWVYGPAWSGPVIVSRPPGMWRPRPVPPRPPPGVRGR